MDGIKCMWRWAGTFPSISSASKSLVSITEFALILAKAAGMDVISTSPYEGKKNFMEKQVQVD